MIVKIFSMKIKIEIRFLLDRISAEEKTGMSNPQADSYFERSNKTYR